MIKTQEDSGVLEKLFNPQDQSQRIDLTVLREICASEDYHKLIDLTFILTKLFLAGKQKLSIRELIGKTVHAEKKENQEKVDFFVNSLSGHQLSEIAKELFQIRRKLKQTIYSSRLHSVITLLLKVYEEFNPQIDRKTDQLGKMFVGDFQFLEEDYKRAQNNIQLQFGQSNSKLNELLKNPKNFLEGKFSNLNTSQKFICKDIIPFLERNILTIPLNSHTEKQSQISRILKFINQFLIPQYKLQVQISKNTLVQTRSYTNKLYKQHLSRNYLELLKTIQKIVNEAILCPSSIHIQLLTLRILRRIYLLQDSCTHSSEVIDNFSASDIIYSTSPAETVRNALYLVLRNISLFSEGHDEEIKEAAMLCYKIVNDKNDLELASMIDKSDDMRFLRNSKFYTSKAYIYSEQSQKVYDLTQLGSINLKMHQSIASRQIWTHTILVQKPSSLICWQFYVGGYDIKFGIFKIQQLRNLTQEDYDKGVGCKQVLKIQKVQNTVNNPYQGHIFLKMGVYRLVFDNSFSLMRSKDLFYSILHFQYSS